jgi:hypothetical protein
MAFRGKLIAASGDAKTVKGEKKGYLTAILYLAPNTIGTRKTLCAHASPACIAACLYSAGRGAFSSVQEARKRKSKRFEQDRAGFMADLARDIDKFQAHATRAGFVPCVRLNGTSDILWERIALPLGWNGNGSPIKFGHYPNIMAMFPGLQFYDYSKCPLRLRRGLPKNYDLTFSQAENNLHATKQALADGFRVATVFHALPKKWLGHKVVDGDATDLRFLDPAPCIVGLKAKGKARIDTTGFVK